MRNHGDSAAVAVGVDWGTTRLRAFLFDAAGRVLASRGSAQGVGVAGCEFSAALRDACAGWEPADQPLPAVLCGMIGSRDGWHEAPYLDCPLDLSTLAACATPIEHRRRALRFVPGLRVQSGAGERGDVMRGEETQLLGALHLDASRDGIFCLPGTHSKWVELRDGRVMRFRTHMTGECFALLSQHGTLANAVDANAPWCDASFVRGLDLSADQGGLLSHLFKVRVNRLLKHEGPGECTALLSGILIGHEVRGAVSDYVSVGDICIVGAADIAARYRIALQHLGRASTHVDGERAAAAGLWALAASLQLGRAA